MQQWFLGNATLQYSLGWRPGWLIGAVLCESARGFACIEALVCVWVLCEWLCYVRPQVQALGHSYGCFALSAAYFVVCRQRMAEV